jgi:hypothetical protein
MSPPDNASCVEGQLWWVTRLKVNLRGAAESRLQVGTPHVEIQKQELVVPS